MKYLFLFMMLLFNVVCLISVGNIESDYKDVLDYNLKYDRCDLLALNAIINEINLADYDTLLYQYYIGLFAYSNEEYLNARAALVKVYHLLQDKPRASHGNHYQNMAYHLIDLRLAFYLSLLGSGIKERSILDEKIAMSSDRYRAHYRFETALVEYIKHRNYEEAKKKFDTVDVRFIEFLGPIDYYFFSSVIYYSLSEYRYALESIEESLMYLNEVNRTKTFRSLIWKAIILNRMGREDELDATVKEIRDYMTEYGYSEIKDCYASMIMGQPLTKQERDDINNIRKLVMESK